MARSLIFVEDVDEGTSFVKGACVGRITIFLSVFNVHVQRAPVSRRRWRTANISPGDVRRRVAPKRLQ